MELRQVRLTDPLVAPVIRGLTREYDLRYGEIDEMATVDAEEFDPPAGTFLVLIDGGEVLAGGGLRRVADDTCEVKRMWTAAGHRRKGYASQVLTGLEDAARPSRALSNGVNVYAGEVTNAGVAEAHGFAFAPLSNVIDGLG